MTTQFTTLTQFLRDLRPRNQLILIAVTSAALGIPVLRIAIEDYRGYIALGPGGPPHNVIGWFGQILLKPFKKEPFHTSCYDEKSFQKAGPNGSVAFLKEEDVPAREAPRPTVGSWTAPSRQLTDLASKDIIDSQRYQSFLSSLASESPSKLEIATSVVERHGQALFVASEKPSHPIAKSMYREIGHMHGSDGSMHLNLAPRDAKLVLERGWGQRHPLGGTILYLGDVMVYAPRNEEELELGDVLVGVLMLSITRATGYLITESGGSYTLTERQFATTESSLAQWKRAWGHVLLFKVMSNILMIR
ncbi:hypothetical protein FGSG_07366 [Fusarium graminearum PH-1]|uniref:Luciferase domain-containing protein n=1 Tax=Gibberella zeae (strain ATCC MYA-4620 / CBS 123657 / FGSC 9075 / NRRL 31084 / PH-1) TaxID=229533 RepID=I1RT67_GIBZE|nr:hypothetical protein FGSG_07366 [Fusarium graminearum PH-1]ESU13621.1 hypothetical protein FGSG_07366 [Fusarium graminearum PH-1]EYB27408.1 hypothetical protein FG05_07366 [Fusarium graminearum]|eukprot:XP_011327128.1 hypothetical protein FGSG_07366 [Fusarium graminearum PH-1]